MNVRVLSVAISCACVASVGLASEPETSPGRELFEYRLPGNPTIDTLGPDRFRIGVRLRAPLDEALHAHLGLEEGEGILVDDVIADSPAARAGLRALDVIVQVDGAAVYDTGSFARALRSGDGQPLTLEIVRRGQRQQLEVEPQVEPLWLDLTLHRRNLNSYLPGVLIAPVTLPPNVEVQLTKRGAEPARLRVQRDDRTWQLSEDELDQLPDDLRVQVQRLLPGIAGPAWHLRSGVVNSGSDRRMEIYYLPVGQSPELAPQPGSSDRVFRWQLGFERQPREEDPLDKVLRQLEVLTERMSNVEAALEGAAPGR